MKIWFDTEFYEDGQTIQLISIGMVREDGVTYYAETGGAHNLAEASEWLSKNVAPHLRGPVKNRGAIAHDIEKFVGDKPEFWAYYADYDWVALCQLYGTMMDLPKGWPMYCRDVKQLCDSLGNPTLKKQALCEEHNALADALWTKKAWEYLMEYVA